MSKIQFIFHDRRVILNERKRLKLFLEQVFTKENKKIEKILIVFCSDAYLLCINKEFLKHDFYTDIITFDLGSSKGGIEAEIYISADRLKENAKMLNNPFELEVHRIIFHGVMHLCGYNDKTREERKLMTLKEDQYLKMYFK